uniref:Uncharacterized protein n=1 Tax=Eutreptiella gymnastica TaxID=73025 RepID=A0A7S4FPB8_9EUGL|eukprot:CAMPEP_0174302166 /NCGR_PEP_ID=MMETSP0809-20121228/59476_1 /TAXON_ID=73025 ORGANISM="Eutreptiella gymnastica-like, Strain CCMP1594" /NCGR_SAMPLE_ID=MMETSP0809 /ASSEMBLY_ACC=CAM_ASM_000658 /LENGTH=343 /DNA_ID=CAMNT_0015408043 /DNA_START=93 /DNA_END=1124 /DNA_ORIENTATION=-
MQVTAPPETNGSPAAEPNLKRPPSQDAKASYTANGTSKRPKNDDHAEAPADPEAPGPHAGPSCSGTLFIARHCERLDRRLEAEGKTWLGNAARPHDSPLSEVGKSQARQLAAALKDRGVTRIISSPLIRCMQTSEIVAEELGLEVGSVYAEEGLCEEAPSLRDPKPPYFLRPHDLRGLCSRVNLEYKSVRPVEHRYDEGAVIRDLKRKPKQYRPGADREFHSVRELHDTIPKVDTSQEEGVVDRLSEITAHRCGVAIDRVLADSRHSGHRLLLVGHGASTKWVVAHLLRQGTKSFPHGSVGSMMELTRVDGAPGASWKAETDGFVSGHLSVKGKEGCGDSGAP